MGKIMRVLGRYKVEIVLFLFIYFFLTEGFGCKIFTRFDFDSQAFLFWQYAGIGKYMPYRDIFYPYGILFYFKDTNLFFQLLFYAIPALLSLVVYFLVKKVYVSWFFALIVVCIFIVFIQRFTGLETVGRYGVAATYALLFGWVFSRQIVFRKWMVACIGVSIGLVFSLLNDQGIYVVILFLFFLIVGPFLRQQYKDVKQAMLTIVLYIVIFVSSFLVGLLPLFGYLLTHNSVSSFLRMFLQNSDIALFAKTPFPPHAASAENMFTFLILFISIGILLSKRFIYKQKYETLDFLQVSIVVLLILLEQKSIIRSIDSQITFLALLLYIFFFSYVIKFFQKEKKSLLYPFVILVGLMVFIFSSNTLRHYQKDYIAAGTFNERYCATVNNQHFTQKYPDYQKVITYVRSNSARYTRVFSYPGDPLFYVLFGQIIPYYPSSYEATPLYGQEKQIAFMKNEGVEYVIYNTEIQSIQDGVPDYIRTPEETAYIFTHFSPIKKIGKFLIFKRDDNSDIFRQSTVVLPRKFAQFLLDINLASIPKSESIYKSKAIMSSEIVIKGSLESVNRYLNTNNISSRNLFFFLKTSTNNDVRVWFNTDMDLSTDVMMKDCTKGCIVNVSKLPLFYNLRNIIKTDISNGEQASLLFFRTTNKIFW